MDRDYSTSYGRVWPLKQRTKMQSRSSPSKTTKFDSESSPRLAQAGTLATSLSLDMATWWQPSVEGFYQRLPKATMLHIVKEAKARFLLNADKLKKQEFARHVAKAVTGSG